jgi:phage gp16-like protein
MRQSTPSPSFAGIHRQRQRQNASRRPHYANNDAAQLDKNFSGDARAQGDVWQWLTVEQAARLTADDDDWREETQYHADMRAELH